jgi:ABC-type multidrug transport system permease subunit
MPAALRAVARVNPVSYAVDLMRAALGEPSEFGAARSVLVLTATTLLVFLVTAVVFDPEQRFVARRRPVGG